jgi:hypothetical protein
MLFYIYFEIGKLMNKESVEGGYSSDAGTTQHKNKLQQF